MKILSLILFIICLSGFTSSMIWRRLNDGNRIPPIGLGTAIEEVKLLYKMEQAVIWAIESGYRLIDTASLYGSEPEVGRAISNVTSRGIVRREDLFISTKLNVTVTNREGVMPALKDSLKRLQTTYVDLFLLHTPLNVFNATNFDLLDIWKGFEDAKKLGLVKSIGVSNCNSTYINDILTYSKIRPAVNEIEVSTTFAELELVAYCQSEDIMVIAFSPLGVLVPRPSLIDDNVRPIFKDPILTFIAHKYNKSDIQIDIRYLIERGTVPIPRSINIEHIKENINVFDFCLTQDEQYLMKSLDQNERVYPRGQGRFASRIRRLYEATKGLQ